MMEEKSAAKLREERLLEKQRLAEQARIAHLEEKMDNRIFELKKTLAQTSEPLLRADLQNLILEEEQKRDLYYEKKWLEEEEKRRLAEEEQATQKYTDQNSIDLQFLEEQVAEEIEKQMSGERVIALEGETAVDNAVLRLDHHSSSDKKERWRQEEFSGSSMICFVIILLFLIGVFVTYKQAATNYRVRLSGLSVAPGKMVPVASDGGNPSSAQSLDIHSVDYQVQVDIDNLTIRSQPSKSAKNLGAISRGVHAIIGEVESDGYTWGQLKSGKGWIALDYTTRVVAPNLSNHSVPAPSSSSSKTFSNTRSSSSSKVSSKTNNIADQDPQYKNWVSTYGNWTASIVYTFYDDGTATIRTSGGTLKYKIHFEIPQDTTKVWGLVLDDNGAPQEPKEYVANAIFTLEPLDGGPSQTLYGVLLRNGQRELTDGEYSEHPNSVYRGGSKNNQTSSSSGNSSSNEEEE